MLNWYGDEVAKNIILAAAKSMDKVMAKCVTEAKKLVPVKTTTLQGSIRMTPVKEEAGDLVGRWGSHNVKYALFVETGTSRMSAQPYLRPAADRFYPTLPDEIKRAMA